MFSLLAALSFFILLAEGEESELDKVSSEDARFTAEPRNGRGLAGVVSVEERSIISRLDLIPIAIAVGALDLLKPGVENEGKPPLVFTRTNSYRQSRSWHIQSSLTGDIGRCRGFELRSLAFS